MQKDLQLLKDVLSVPTKTYREHLMIQYLSEWLQEQGFDYYVDEHGNVYATKQESKELPKDFYFPCVVAHTDTVHNLDQINVIEVEKLNAQGELKPSLTAINNLGLPTGIGGDDKCGVFACMKLLQEMPNLKAAFFVSEETGCHGSKKADEKFFKNVGYVIQFDAPENWMVTEKCFGQILFDRDTEFFKKCDKVLTESMVQENMEYMVHPYTDVYALRTKFNFSCINFSIGYYDYHTEDEYVVIEDVFNGIKMGKEMIESLGCKLYYKKAVQYNGYKQYLFD